MDNKLKYRVPKKLEELPEKYRTVVNIIGSGHKVLELGCCRGEFSEHIKGTGNYVIGIDYDNDAVLAAEKKCNEAYSVDLNNPTGLDSVLEDNRFQYILAMDVLEHLIDPEKLLKHLHNFLVPEGKLIVTLPNIASWGIRKKLLLGDFTYTKVGVLDSTHLRFFTFYTAQELLLKGGFAVKSWKPLSYQLPLVGRLGLRKIPLIKSVTRHVEDSMASFFPNFCAAQILFITKLMNS
jgi:2-polyprenyl-3-methyl-5-hydroxy-6-metoxy-1,4-benzoquinol methylase